VQSVLDQEYNNVELMLIDNGANTEISEYLSYVHLNNKNTALVTFQENQFSWDDPDITVAICWNAGLIHSKGEVISHLSYDDMFSKNYSTKMVQLFDENPDCMTAGPLPISINSSGNINVEKDYLKSNNRPRYSDGKKVALDFIQGSPQKMFSAPGEIFAIRKSLLLKYSGFEQGIDILQILKYAINGSIGFDPEAHVYWRHHDQQTNLLALDKKPIAVKNLKLVIKRSDIINIWSKSFSFGEVKLLEKYLKNKLTLIPLQIAQLMINNRKLFGLLLVFFYTAKQSPKNLGRTILYSISYTIKLLFNKLKSKISS
tara:strand:- start:36 stop:980 length:945 start_codon:yes stop_codon:yes gene_type:complete